MSTEPKEDASGNVVLRAPGLLEAISTCRHALGLYTAVCTSARFTADAQGSNSPPPAITLPRLYAALHLVIAQHPPLAVSVIEELEPSARFVRLASIDLARVVTFETLPEGTDEAARERLLNDAYEARLSARFDGLPALPLWRLLVHAPAPGAPDQSFDVSLFIHHALADGTSAVLFMGALQRALNGLGADADGAPLFTPPAADLAPSVEGLHKMPVSSAQLARALWGLWFPRARKGVWAATPCARPADCVRTRNVTRVFPAETAAALLAAARARGATLTPLLEALAARALLRALPPDARAVRGECPINLRPYMPAQKEAMGVLVASSEHEFTRRRAEGDVWAEAARVGRELKRVLADIRKNKHVNTGMLRFAGGARKFTEDKLGKPRGAAFELSNTGAFDGGAGGAPWRVARLLFTQSANAPGAAVQFNVSSVRGGPLVVAVSWEEGVVGEELVQAVLDDMGKSIDAICAEKL